MNKSTWDEYETALDNAEWWKNKSGMWFAYWQQHAKELRCKIAMNDW